MEQVLMITGAGIVGLLGVVHLLLTFLSDRFKPRDPTLMDAMMSVSPVISREATLWKAWVGFNASHSLGAILLAAFYIPLSALYPDIIASSLWFSLLPVVAGVCYVILAKRYWFKVPLVGMSVATLCFIGALF